MEVSTRNGDYEAIAQIIFSRLCEMDKEQKSLGRVPRWHEIETLASDLNSCDNRINIAILSEMMLLDELGYLQRNPIMKRIRLSGYGRLRCNTNQVWSSNH